jgi:sec-independent protein translocase protein TatC
MALVPFPAPVPEPVDTEAPTRLDLDDIDDAEEAAGAKMSFLEHLDELRKRLINSALALLVGCAIAFLFVGRIQEFILVPLHQLMPPGSKLIFTEGPEAFLLMLKIGALAGLMIATPFIIWQLWLFIAPGLYAHEKRFAIPFVLSGTILFLSGAMNSQSCQMMNGVVFQIPTVTFFLARMGVVTPGFLVRHFKYAVLLIFVIAAVLTPPDVVSQCLMALPMILLYGLSIGIAWAFQKRR